MSMTRKEVANYIDIFKYWCEINEEMGVITLPKFICDHIIEILDDSQHRPHGKWEWVKEDKYRCTNCSEVISVKEVMNVPQYITCPMCNAAMQKGDNKK